MSRRALGIWFAAAFLLAALLTLPLRAAISWLGISPPLTAGQVDGTVWRGQLRDAHWQRAALGDLSIRLRPWQLALGTLQLDAQGSRFATTLLQGRRRGAEALRGSLDLEHAGLLLRLSFQDTGAVFDGKLCRRAAGALTIELPDLQTAAGAPLLHATPRCEGREWVAEFEAPSTTERPRPSAELRLDADGNARLVARVEGADPVLTQVLAAHGFESGPQGQSLTTSSQLWRSP